MDMITDCHIHSALGHKKALTLLTQEELVEQLHKSLESYSALGIHALRDGGDQWGMGILVRAISKDLPITYRTPIQAIYKKGLYGNFLGSAVTNSDEGQNKIDLLKQEGADFIKIILTGIMSFEQLGLSGPIGFSLAELKIMVDHAHQRGLKTMVHVNSKEAIMMAIEAQVDTIEHGYGIDFNCLERLSETEIIWVPTLAPFANIAKLSADAKMGGHREMARKYFSQHQKQVKKANQLGVKIALGSDSGASSVGHGQGTLDELNYLRACGLTLEKLEQNAIKIMA